MLRSNRQSFQTSMANSSLNGTVHVALFQPPSFPSNSSFFLAGEDVEQSGLCCCQQQDSAHVTAILDDPPAAKVKVRPKMRMPTPTKPFQKIDRSEMDLPVETGISQEATPSKIRIDDPCAFERMTPLKTEYRVQFNSSTNTPKLNSVFKSS